MFSNAPAHGLTTCAIATTLALFGVNSILQGRGDIIVEDREDFERVVELYSGLRDRLLDLSGRNPLISFRHRPGSKNQLRFVGTTLDGAFARIVSNGVEIRPVPEPDDMPADERTPEFKAQLDYMRAFDQAYQANLKAAQTEGLEESPLLAKAERALRSAVRELLGLPPVATARETNPKSHAQHLGIDTSWDMPKSHGKAGEPRYLQTLQWPDSLDAILDRLADDARLAEQEMGMSTLFCVFGFLDWFESESSDKIVTSPLSLLPVKLELKRQAGAKTFYKLVSRDEPLDTNLSLRKRLERDFKIVLPDLAPKSDDEDDETSVEEYLALVEEAVATQKRWKVRPQITLGHFKFGRLAMYAELDPANWQGEHPVANPLVRAVLSGSEISGDGGSSLGGFPDDYPIDEEEYERFAPFLIHNADASQHSALIDVMKGENLVIQGPPGTGKSQTITNVIANAIAQGKSVLFLADKLAALEVVKRRMDSAGLGDFCLELHSDKASARHVVASLKRRAAVKPDATRPSPRATSLTEGHREIVGYLDALHAETPNGDTPFQVLWKALRSTNTQETQPDPSGLALPAQLLNDPLAVAASKRDLGIYAGMRERFEAQHGSLAVSPWSELKAGERLTRGSTASVAELCTALQDATKRYVKVRGDLRPFDLGDPVPNEQTLAALRSIEVAKPNAGSLTAARQHDAAEMLRAASITMRLLQLKQGARACVKLDNLDDAQLEYLLQLSALAAEFGMAGTTPSQFVADIKFEAGVLKGLVDIVEQSKPALLLASIRNDSPASSVLALNAIVQCLAQVNAPLRLWAIKAGHRSIKELSRAHEEWKVLVENEAKFRSRFPAAGAWPARKTIEHVRALLGKGMLSRLLGGFVGDRRSIEALASTLGVSLSAIHLDGELEQLGHHVEALARFLANRHYSQIFGDHWTGLDTPVAACVSAARAVLELHQLLAADGSSAWLAGELRALTEKEVQNLVGFRRSLGQISSITPTALELLSSHSIESLRLLAMRFEDALRRLGQAEIPDAFRSATSPLDVVAKSVAAERQSRYLASQLRAYPPRLTGLLVQSASAAEELHAAAAWIMAVRGARLPPNVEAALLCDPEQYENLQLLLADAAKALEDIDQLKRRLKDDHELEGWPIGPEQLEELVDKLVVALPQLGDFAGLCAQHRVVQNHGVGPLLGFLDSTHTAPTDFAETFDRWVTIRRAMVLRNASPALRDASGMRLDALRSDFIYRDRLKLDADRAEVRLRLQKRIIPLGTQHGPRKKWTEMGLLRNEFGKERKFVPVRDLLRRAGGAVQALKPCFMMSPLSLAKFVQAGTLKFDVLVVDEASQMRPEDALGGLLRATQIVVVGDPKQLPPTDFFARTSGADGEASDDEDQNVGESILELCQKTFRKTRILRWHYRSRCESLIAFSNKHFYRNELITFPTARARSFSVDHQFVAGTYSAGQNAIEAQQLVQYAVGIIKGRACEVEAIPSLGIVAVNSEQRDLIKAEWKRVTAGDETVGRYTEAVRASGEEFFIKNLENVQGDERDIIIVSMTYGPAPGQTKPHQRFGPIGGKNGHRRLNVLFSRARESIVLFTSLRSSDVIPKQDSGESQGVRVLHEYLRYAEAGGQEVPDQLGGEPDSDFEVAVRDRLRKCGFAVHTQVGVSGYRIDLGVINPDRPGEYLAGVECDGATYHSSKSARDRDRLRQDCLREKGWELVRIWSTDWFDNPDVQTANVVRQLQALREKAKQKVQMIFPIMDPVPPQTALQDQSPNVISLERTLREMERTSQDRNPHRSAVNVTGDASQRFAMAVSFGERDQQAFAVEELSEPARTDLLSAIPVRAEAGLTGGNLGTFVEADLSKHIADPDQFYEPAYLGRLKQMVDLVVATEGPLFQDVLVTRIARHHGFARSGAQIFDRVDRAVDRRCARTVEDGRTVIWPLQASTTILVPFRGGVPSNRDIGDVPVVEIASVAHSFLAQGMIEDDVLLSMRQFFGLGRLRETSRVRFEAALRMALKLKV